MSKIDELSGVDLDRAVAHALGWREGEILKGSYIYRRNNRYTGESVATFSPHSNNAQAFNIGISLFWYFEEYHGYIEAQCSDGASVYRARADYANDDEKATAYATARCRAWLKAEAGEESPNA